MVEQGIILLSMKNYDESLEVFEKALRLREKEAKIARTSEKTRDAKLKIAKIRHNIGCVNFEVGKLDEAEDAYTEAINAQKAAFGTWATPFLILTDTTRPGFLTMASTMCNRGTIFRLLVVWCKFCSSHSFIFHESIGYIALEQARYNDAITIFFESLKVRRIRA